MHITLSMQYMFSTDIYMYMYIAELYRDFLSLSVICKTENWLIYRDDVCVFAFSAKDTKCIAVLM